MDRFTRERLDCYADMGYDVHYCSAVGGEGVEGLVSVLEEKMSMFVGQSGVGKSSLLNRIDPNLKQRIGEISRKYDRGAHTTSYASLFDLRRGVRVIDTPGIRELQIFGVSPGELGRFYRDFQKAS